MRTGGLGRLYSSLRGSRVLLVRRPILGDGPLPPTLLGRTSVGLLIIHTGHA